MKIIDINKPRYRRRGKCLRCGACCLNENCKHLVFDKKTGLATCKIFKSPKRPAKCKNFPAAPPIIFETCGFYFLDTWENNRIVKPKKI